MIQRRILDATTSPEIDSDWNAIGGMCPSEVVLAILATSPLRPKRADVTG